MLRRGSAALALCLVIASPASAHRLDEYLQATRVAVARDGVTVELDLTPGAAIAASVLRLIDRDTDGSFSPVEVERYARAVLSDLTIAIDGQPVSPRLLRAEAASWGEFIDGVGAIRVKARVDTAIGGGPHVIRLENRHRRDVSVYLANALVPSTRSIEVIEQRRDARQQTIEIDLRVESRTAALPWLLAPLIALGGLVIARTTRPRPLGPHDEPSDVFHDTRNEQPAADETKDPQHRRAGTCL